MFGRVTVHRPTGKLTLLLRTLAGSKREERRGKGLIGGEGKQRVEIHQSATSGKSKLTTGVTVVHAV